MLQVLLIVVGGLVASWTIWWESTIQRWNRRGHDRTQETLNKVRSELAAARRDLAEVKEDVRDIRATERDTRIRVQKLERKLLE